MAFTTWTALHTALKNALADSVASGNFIAGEMDVNTGSSSRRVKYRTLDELRGAIAWVSEMAAIETGGTSAPVGRTYAKNGGGGRW